jgi:hypothetical protein
MEWQRRSGGPGGQQRGVRGAEGHCEVDGVVEVVGDVLQRRRDTAGGAPCGCDLLVASASSFYGQIEESEVFRGCSGTWGVRKTKQGRRLLA